MAKLPPKIGRPPIFKNPEELLRCFMEYIEEDVIPNNKLANMAGFRRYHFIPKSTLFEYEKREEFSDSFELINDIIHDDTLNNRNVETAIRLQVMKSKLGYIDMSKVETKNENVNTNVEVDDDDFIQQLKEKYLKGK